MKEIKLSLRLTPTEYDSLEDCVADELHRAEVFAGEDSALAATLSSLQEKITAARLGKNTCSTCSYCVTWENGETLCYRYKVALPMLSSHPACKDYTPQPASHD